MGIPKLIQSLQPFAERAIFCEKDSSARGNNNSSPPLARVTSVLIDGPSLIYHTYHRLLSLKVTKSHHRNSSSPHGQSHLSSNHPLQSQPIYTEINQAVLAFVNHLQSHHGVEVQKIYFDGALPASKRDVRLARLEDSRRKLVEFRQLHSNSTNGSCNERNAYDGALLARSFSSSTNNVDGHGAGFTQHINAKALFQLPAPLPPTFKFTPAPPFMVASAIEYLRSQLDPVTSIPTSRSGPTSTTPSSKQAPQRHSALIQIVPGEADTYCAAHAKRTGAAILTSDSDLLAYDLGSQGSVILLNSLELSALSSEAEDREEGMGKQMLCGTRYHALSITSKLALSCSLQRLCFHRSLDPAIGISELKLRCHGPLDAELGSSTEEEWRRFMQRYCTDGLTHLDDDGGEGDREAQSEKARRGGNIPQLHFQGLDPRIAELVTQFQGPSTHPAHPGRKIRESEAEVEDEVEDEHRVLHMYLPFLVEDPSRDSAWSHGRSIRHLAYALLQHYMFPFPSTPTTTGKLRRRPRIKEYQRRGARIAGLDIDIDPDIPSHRLDNEIEELLQSFKEHLLTHNAKTKTATTTPSSPASSSNIWRCFAVSLLSSQRILNNKPAPPNTWVNRYLHPKGVVYTPASWDDVHNQASVEAVLYSLRILKQIAGFCLYLGVGAGFSSQEEKGEEEEEEGEEKRVRALVDALGHLPPIAELMVAAQNAEVEVGIGKPSKRDGEIGGGLSRTKDGNASRSRDGDLDPDAEHQVNAKGKKDHFLASAKDESSERSWKRVKRRKTSSESKWEKDGKTVKKRSTNTQGVGDENMFAALEDAME